MKSFLVKLLILLFTSLLFFSIGRCYQYYVIEITPIKEILIDDERLTLVPENTSYLALKSVKTDENCSLVKAGVEKNNSTESIKGHVEQLANMKDKLLQDISRKVENAKSAEQLVNNLSLLKTVSKANLTDIQIAKVLSFIPQSSDKAIELTLLHELSGLMTEDYLPYLETSFYSNDDDVLEEAFLRLEELGGTQATQSYLDWFANHPTNEFVRIQAKKLQQNSDNFILN